MSIAPDPQQLVSIIIPSHRSAKWLPECLDSVRALTYPSWEAVVVIDGTADESESIARGYADVEGRFRVVVIPHGGPGAARNAGLDASVGEYVFFLDSDDIITVDALDILCNAAMTNDVDIVAGIGEDTTPDGTTTVYWTQRSQLHRSGVAVADLESAPEFLADHVVWNKLYRRRLLDEVRLRFPTGVHCEDLVFSARASLAARRISVVPRVVYRHRRHEGAISTDYLRATTLVDWMSQSELVLDTVSQLASTDLRDYHFVNFCRQWWSRARSFDRMADRATLLAFERFTARSVRARLSPSTEIRDLVRSAIDFVAGSGLSRYWSAVGSGHNPFDDDDRSVASRADLAIRATNLLDPADPVCRRMAVALLSEAVLDPIASGAMRADAESEVNALAAAAQVIDRLGVPELATRLGPDAAHNGRGLVDQYIARRRSWLRTKNPRQARTNGTRETVGTQCAHPCR
ncbi:glycosyltransferase [Agromyces sp. H66]|uniref:glycosyltransferase family 2 protein n=1 Tax=Agromyces sp. H66 TaxID=2529859 RepID=UPI00145B079A|nr:glycosyltransferase [Agromyces sp. H66]